MSTLSPYQNDPFYDSLRARARLNRAKKRVPLYDQSGGNEEGPSIDSMDTQMMSSLGLSASIKSPSSKMSIESTGPVVGPAAPRFGTTKEYTTAMRIAEGISANTGPLLAASVLESTAPIVAAVKRDALKVGLDQTPSYLQESTAVGDLKTQVGGFQADKSYLREATGVFREVSDDELGDYPQNQILSAREAAERNPLGYVGPDPTTPTGQLTKAALNVASAFSPALGMTMSTVPGEILESPIGTPFTTGSGIAKMFSTENYRTMWETHGNMQAGIPGNFGMKIGNSYVTYQSSGNNNGVVSGRTMNAQQFEKLYATQLGYDYRTVDFEASTPGNLAGEKLQGFSDGVGGFSKTTGEFVDNRGKTYSDLTREQARNYVTSLSYDPDQLNTALSALESKKEQASKSFFGADFKQQTYQMAIDEVRDRIKESSSLLSSLSPEEYAQTMQQMNAGRLSKLSAKEIQEMGRVVNLSESENSPSAKKYRTITDPVTGRTKRVNFNLEKDDDSDPLDDPKVGTSVVGGREYTTISSGEPTKRSDEVYFAEGGQAGDKNTEQIGPVGFVNGRSPEEVTDADTVKDDVEGSVADGTFIINAVAVERYGSERIRKLLMSALQEAEKQGIDISSTDSTITDEDSVSIAVSEGEVLIPPVLVRIIGLEKLEKINALGQEEVEKRVVKYGQADTSEPVEGEAPIQASVDGSFIERQ